MTTPPPGQALTAETVKLLVKGPRGFLVKDFADGWYWTPNAAIECTTGALVWSVEHSRYETEPDLATQPAPSPGGDELSFLIARLHDFENDINERDWHGHVAPALARLKTALPAAPSIQKGGEG